MPGKTSPIVAPSSVRVIRRNTGAPTAGVGQSRPNPGTPPVPLEPLGPLEPPEPLEPLVPLEPLEPPPLVPEPPPLFSGGGSVGLQAASPTRVTRAKPVR